MKVSSASSRLKIPASARAACRNLVKGCAALRSDEQALIITDTSTVPVGEAVCSEVLKVTGQVRHLTVRPFKCHGENPSPQVAAAVKAADVVFCLTRMSMAHTRFRRDFNARGGRFLSLPDYSMVLLARPGLRTDFRKLLPLGRKISAVLAKAENIHVATTKGTCLGLNVKGRPVNNCPGWCYEKGSLASPPDAEVNVASRESLSEGVIVVDGSIPCPQIGLLASPLILEIKKGRIVNIRGKKATTLTKVLDGLKTPRTRVLAEFGLGMNPKARLCGIMLEDEGCQGTAHFGFGSNATIGGRNNVPFHLDMVVRTPTVTVDGRILLKKNRFNV